MIALLIFCCFTDKMCVISFFLDGHEGKRRNPRNVIRPDPRGVVGGWGTLIGRLRNWTTSLSFWWMRSISERGNDI